MALVLDNENNDLQAVNSSTPVLTKVERKDKTELDLQQKSFLLFHKAAGKSYKEICGLWSSRFKRTPPDRSSIYKLSKKALTTGIQSRKNLTGRKRTVNTEKMRKIVKNVRSFKENNSSN